MRYYVNRAVVNGPWGGGNAWVRAMYECIPSDDDQVLNPTDFRARPDVIFIAGLESDNNAISAEQAIMYKMYVGDVKLIARINENDARKNTNYVDENLLKLSEYVDGTVFVSEWLRDYFIDRGWKCETNTVIHNGVDSAVFKQNEKLNNGKTNIVTHHWSDNELKGFDFYELIDKMVGQSNDFSFTYIGRERGTFKNSTVIKPLFGKHLGDELGKYDVYVSASRHDPGPNHILESISCKIPTYVHADGGGAVEFAGQDHVFKCWEDLLKILETKEFTNNTYEPTDWNTCVKRYVQFAQSIK